MIYGYIRVSTDKQCTENQRYEIEKYCKRSNVSVDSWVEETVSGTKRVEGRKLGRMLKRMRKGDILICAELSRLGRNLMLHSDMCRTFKIGQEPHAYNVHP